MGIFLGSNPVDLKIGATNEYWYLSCIDVQDLTAYYQKQETLSRQEVVSSLNVLMRRIDQNFYTKDEIDTTISAYEIEYRILGNERRDGSIQLVNRVQNVICPSADISCVMPRTIRDNLQLGRDFFVQIVQPENPVDVEFVGYGGEEIRIFPETDYEFKEMEGSKRYVFYMNEISSGQFFGRQMELKELSSIEGRSILEYDLSTYRLYDCETNCLELGTDSLFVFPDRNIGLSGEWKPRDFMLYVRQPETSAYNVEFVGVSGETLLIRSFRETFPEMEAGGRYLYSMSELSCDVSSAEFVMQMMSISQED